MPKTRQQKETVVQDLVEKFKKMKGIVFTKYFGLTVHDIDELRAQCRAEGIDYVVAKKSLIKVALEKSGITGVNPREFDGEVSTAISYLDEVAPARVVAKFAKKHDKMQFLGGILEGKMLDEAAVKRLAALPSKQQLLGQLVGTINAPVSGFVRVLAGNLRGLVNVLNAIQKLKQ